MATFQSIIDSAKVFLQDPTSVRYTEAQLMEYANEAIAEAKRARPDFFFGSYTTALSTYVVGDTVPLPVEYHAYVKDYICGRAELRDDEYAVDGRAVGLLARFKQGLAKA